MRHETSRRATAFPTGYSAYELRAGRTIQPGAFKPVPAVESALLTLAPRGAPLLSPAAFGEYDAFLGAVFDGRGRTVADRLARRCGRRRAAGRRGVGCGGSRGNGTRGCRADARQLQH
jgi:hypothetical protein